MIFKHIYRSDRWPNFRTGCRSPADVERLVSYLLRPAAKPEVLHNDFSGDTPEDIAEHMALMHRGQKIMAYHVVASHPHEEAELWQPQQARCIQDVHERFCIEQALWVKHGNHWHGVLMAMKPNGGTISLSGYGPDGQRTKVATAFRNLAQEWEDRTPGCRKTGRGVAEMSFSRETLAMAEREYAEQNASTPIPRKLLLKTEVGRIVALAATFEQMHALADEAGITVNYKTDETGNVLGISFTQDGVSLRGRDAGVSFTHLETLYGKPNSTIIRQHTRLEKGTRPTDCRAHHRRTYEARRATGRPLGADLHRTGEASRGGSLTGNLYAATLRALMPKEQDTSIGTLLLTLSRFLFTICRQNDYYSRPYQSIPSPDIPL